VAAWPADRLDPDPGSDGPTARETATAHEACDLLIVPRIEGVELRDWRAFDPAVAAGYDATQTALKRLDRPLSQLRLPVLLDDEMFGTG
jgi:NTE family protein